MHGVSMAPQEGSLFGVFAGLKSIGFDGLGKGRAVQKTGVLILMICTSYDVF